MIVLMMVQIKIDVAHYLSTIIEHDNSDDEDGTDVNQKTLYSLYDPVSEQ